MFVAPPASRSPGVLPAHVTTKKKLPSRAAIILSHQEIHLTSRIMKPSAITMRFGSKKVYLPNFTLGLLRTTHLPPNFVQFKVPLNINKLDLKDYLYHAYGVECLSVRSYIEQQKIKHAKPELGGRRVEWYRPRAIKKMTVELKDPFVYPEEPKDLGPWGKEDSDKMKEVQKKYQEAYSAEAVRKPSPARAELRKQVMAMFEVEKKIKA